MVETAAYKEWLASAPTDVAEIETIEVWHATWDGGNPRAYLLCNWDNDIQAALNDGEGLQTFTATRFHLEPAATSGLANATQIVISSLDGLLYDAFKGLSVTDRQTPIILRPRSYFHNDLTKPLITPQPVWTLHNVQATYDVLAGELRATPLRERKAGIYYTTTEFPALVYS